MPRVPTRITGPSLIATGPTTIYTVPASTKVVIRHFHVMNNSGTAATFTFSIGADAAGTRVYGPYSVAANSDLDRYGPFTMEAAEILTVSSGTNNVLVQTFDADIYTAG